MYSDFVPKVSLQGHVLDLGTFLQVLDLGLKNQVFGLGLKTCK